MYLRRGGVGELRRVVRPQEQTANELLDGLLHAARTLDTARAAAADEDSGFERAAGFWPPSPNQQLGRIRG